MKLTQETLKEMLDYNPETGVFNWNIDKGKRGKSGKIAGCLNKRGYWRIRIDNKDYYAQRLAFLWMEGYLPENDIDHIDRDKLNNKWINLREVSKTCNKRNQSTYKNNTSGITGVVWDKKNNKWVAKIHIPKKINLGYFDNIIEAVKARWEGELKYNFPNCSTTSSAYVYLKEHDFFKAIKKETI